jgi:hypothetical protein
LSFRLCADGLISCFWDTAANSGLEIVPPRIVSRDGSEGFVKVMLKARKKSPHGWLFWQIEPTNSGTWTDFGRNHCHACPGLPQPTRGIRWYLRVWLGVFLIAETLSLIVQLFVLSYPHDSLAKGLQIVAFKFGYSLQIASLQ